MAIILLNVVNERFLFFVRKESPVKRFSKLVDPILEMITMILSRSAIRCFALVLAFFSPITIVAEEKTSKEMLVRTIRQLGQATQEQRKKVVDYIKRQEHKPSETDPVIQAVLEKAETIFGPEHRAITDPLEKAILKVANQIWLSQAEKNIETVTAHPQAEMFFGEIPKNAPRVTETITVDTAIGRWQSTGLYAAPGDVIVLKVPPKLIGKRFQVRLSGHSDSLVKTSTWMRPPLPVSVTRTINDQEVKIASRFGGTVYLDLGHPPVDQGRVKVVVHNALKAPVFFLGKTTNKEWVDNVRSHPAPYAEFVGKKAILSVPAAWIRDFDDAQGLTKFWDEVVRNHDALGGVDHLRTSPERINVDIQINVGQYHAGYPLQGPQSGSKNLVNLESLRARGSWGWFHELGHEAQRRPDTAWDWSNPYTFDGSVEVTVNLFSVHANEKMGITKFHGWSWTVHPTEVLNRAKKGIGNPGGYAKSGFEGKLSMFLQIRDEFGWQVISNVLAGYTEDQDKNPSALPKNNQEKRDQFAVRMSKATKRNFVPFLRDLWKIPISDDVLVQVRDLPEWLPVGFSVER